jgi:hypothetical protein
MSHPIPETKDDLLVACLEFVIQVGAFIQAASQQFNVPGGKKPKPSELVARNAIIAAGLKHLAPSRLFIAADRLGIALPPTLSHQHSNPEQV